MRFKPTESLHVHIHHARTEDGPLSEHDCLSAANLKRGEGIGGELAGGLFYVAMNNDGELIIAFVNTVYPENIQSGEIEEPSKP